MAWMATSLLLLLTGDKLLLPLLPLLQLAIDALDGDWLSRLAVADRPGGAVLQLQVLTRSGIPLGAGVFIAKNTTLSATMQILHAYVPVAILLAMLMAWPVAEPLRKLRLLLSGGVLGVLILLLTVPTQLVGLLEMPYQEAALAADSHYRPDWFMDWLVFCETGGNLLLAFLAAGLCIHWFGR